MVLVNLILLEDFAYYNLIPVIIDIITFAIDNPNIINCLLFNLYFPSLSLIRNKNKRIPCLKVLRHDNTNNNTKILFINNKTMLFLFF